MNNHNCQNHAIGELTYRNKTIGTANLKDIDPENVKYTIAFNKEKTRAWHFWKSREVFFKWEADHKTPETTHLLIKEAGDKLKEVKAYIAEIIKG